MENHTINNRRIAKNTAVLYLRTIIILLVSLYSSRVVLQNLGVVDYGVYNVVGGFIAMFAVLSNSLSAAISRFLTYELGRGDSRRLNMIFCVSVKAQVYLSIAILMLAETLGLWFLNTHMVIPEERMVAANWVFQFSIMTFVINLISVPYNACIIAHERMTAFALFSIINTTLSLVAALLISVSPWDSLVFYAFCMVVAALLVRLLYGFYCKKHFEECRFLWKTDKKLSGELMGFAGWNFIGASSGVLRDQGINVVLNLFCGPVVNAARGIAMQVCSAVTSFLHSFTTALNPQITKSYAAGDNVHTIKLVFQGARFSFYLLFIISLPVLMETDYLLRLWLDDFPGHTTAFVRLILLYVMTESVSFSMITLMLATGDIKKYQLLVGGCQMLNLPVAYILMKLGFPPESTFVSSILIAVLCLSLRLYMLRAMVQLPVRQFLRNVLLNILLVGVLSLIIPVGVINMMSPGLPRFLVSCIVCVVSSGFVMLFVGCTQNERAFMVERVKSLMYKIR